MMFEEKEPKHYKKSSKKPFKLMTRYTQEYFDKSSFAKIFFKENRWRLCGRYATSKARDEALKTLSSKNKNQEFKPM